MEQRPTFVLLRSALVLCLWLAEGQVFLIAEPDYFFPWISVKLLAKEQQCTTAC